MTGIEHFELQCENHKNTVKKNNSLNTLPRIKVLAVT